MDFEVTSLKLPSRREDIFTAKMNQQTEQASVETLPREK
jgi:hypothetical protein